MKNLIVITLAIIILCGIALAEKAELPTDGKGIRIQSCAPALKNDVALTGNSQTIEITDSLCWSAYVSSSTKFRTMSTATKTGIQHTLPGGVWHSETTGNNKFINFSTTGAAGTFRSNKP